MIDVFGIASGALGIVNPATTVTVKCSDGYEIQPDGSPKLKTFTLTVEADIQAVSAGDLEHVASINQQADMRAVDIRAASRGFPARCKLAAIFSISTALTGS
ncbi:hypothetical protein [Asaia sp. HumB]|uniref:hypothetical protein n=1 Tax=Asaia sp. HumB TaxID=3035475 RepID=UPI0025534615|nr:hypothetical protein [Asaia sp. HumB]MDL2172464.1 hypothetical protein [Asaia sp. HumB]